jgi:3-hydroxyisobutyrate dehydrogenase
MPVNIWSADLEAGARGRFGSGRKESAMRRVAVLGTGIMGAGMARSLLRSSLDVIVWNRSPGRAAPLAADGAQVAGAVAGADAVVTML